jgi:hypothetical protein
MSALVATKSYPENYPSDAVAILDAMSFSEGKNVRVLGSMSIRSQQYAGDYDAYEIVEREGDLKKVLNSLASDFKDIIKRLRGLQNVFIGDIKAGSVEEWRVFPKSTGVVDGKVANYNATAIAKKVDELRLAGVIGAKQADEALTHLKPSLTPSALLTLMKELRPNVIRWSVSEVLAGQKTLVDGRVFTLQEAFSTPAITKVDVIGLVQNNRFTDFSMIYEFKHNGKVLNPDFRPIAQSLLEDIIVYQNEGNNFKVLKRKYALAKFKNQKDKIKKLTVILNSDLGRLYSLSSDVATLINLLDEQKAVPLERLRYELDQFKSRMANIYSLPDFLKAEYGLIGDLNSAMKMTNRAQLKNRLEEIEETMRKILNKNTPKVGGRYVGGLYGEPDVGPDYLAQQHEAALEAQRKDAEAVAKAEEPPDWLKGLVGTVEGITDLGSKIPVVGSVFKAANDLRRQILPSALGSGKGDMAIRNKLKAELASAARKARKDPAVARGLRGMGKML